jgi:flagellar protein FlaJ
MVKIPERFLDINRHRDLQTALLGARKEISLRRYLSLAIYCSALVFVIGLAGGYFLFSWRGQGFVPSISFAVLMALALVGLTYWAFLKYPSITLSGRKTKIDSMLPNSVAYMYALSKGEIEVTDIFRSMSEDESLGEMTKEARAVVRNIEYMGQDPISAIREVARTTPSDKFRNFLELLASTVTTGGDLGKYLESKCRQFYEEASASQRRSLESLGLMAEFYVILLGFGPLLAVIMLVVFGMIGTLNMSLLYILVYFVIPFGFAFFVLLISRFSVSPGVVVHAKKTESEPKGVEKGELIKAFEKGKFSGIFKKFQRSLNAKPTLIFLISAPVAIVLSLVQVFLGQFSTSTVFFAILVLILPFIVFYEIKKSRIEKIEGAFPDLLFSLSSSMASGLTPAQAIKSVSAAQLGPLSSELRKVSGEMEWGASTSEAISNFDERVGSGMVSRLTRVMKKAMASSGEISDVVNIMAGDASTTRSLRQERRGTMMTYIIVVYMSVIVFTVTAGLISTSLITLAPTLTSPIAGISAGVGFPQGEVKLLLFHAALIQGFLGGMLAGQLGAGDVWSGLKHSVLMLVIAYVIFNFWVFA